MGLFSYFTFRFFINSVQIQNPFCVSFVFCRLNLLVLSVCERDRGEEKRGREREGEAGREGGGEKEREGGGGGIDL